MKAVVWTEYGPPEGLRLEDVEKPFPRDNELLIRVSATTVTMGDCEFRKLQLPLIFRVPMRIYVGIQKPERIKILGQELAGEIEAVGKNVIQYKIGDQVFGMTNLRLGAYAEYVCLPENGVLAIKPSGISYEEAAAIPLGGMNALSLLRKANIRSGQKVLIIGAGGSIGTYAVQIARHFGAEVTAMDSADKLDMLRSIGASHVIDYTREDLSKAGASYDVIFDVVGRGSFSQNLKLLKRGGYYLHGNPGLKTMVLGPWASLSGSKKVIAVSGTLNPTDLTDLKGMIEAGIIRPVLDRRYPLEQIVEAHRYVESGKKKGNVVITIDHNAIM